MPLLLDRRTAHIAGRPGPFLIYCYPGDGSGRTLAVTGLGASFTYELGDTVHDGFLCYWRTGTLDPADCI